jgi:Rrf2 family transcriptional regulator, iron-sulfur cluster assembly transcription factor
MIFSKSFGYAVRGILYIASRQHNKQYVQVEEISARLEAPRHFMGKILKRLAKEGILSSVKGPSGGFTTNDTTLAISLSRLLDITNDSAVLSHCVLRLKECNGENPCAMHFKVESVKQELKDILANTTIGTLLSEEHILEERLKNHSLTSHSLIPIF